MSSHPQTEAVYRAQSNVANRHPAEDLADLAAVREYVTPICETEALDIPECHRAWQHTGDEQMIVDRSGMDRDLVGSEVEHPQTHSLVRIVAWQHRYSHYDPENLEIVFGAPPGRPLSHRLLVLHEVAHMILDGEQHDPVWARLFLEVVARRWPEALAELVDQFRALGVEWEPTHRVPEVDPEA